MALYTTSDNEVLEAWAKTLNAKVVANEHALLKVGNGLAGINQRGVPPKHAIVYDMELTGGGGGRRGDKITHTCGYPLAGVGVAGAETLEGKEVRSQTATFQYFINNWRNGVFQDDPMDQQRVSFDLFKSNIEWLALERSRTLTAGVLLHAAGYKGLASSSWKNDGGIEIDQSKSKWNINNDVVAVTSTNHTFANGNTTDQGVAADASAYATRAHLDKLVLDLSNREHLLRPPISIGGTGYYPVLYDQSVKYRLRQDSNWTNILQSLLEGGLIESNPIFTGADFVYENLVFYPIQRLLPRGYHSTTFAIQTGVRRCIVLGAGAVVIGPGSDYTPSRMFKLVRGDSDGGFRQFAHSISLLGVARPHFIDPNDTSITHSNVHVWSVRV